MKLVSLFAGIGGFDLLPIGAVVAALGIDLFLGHASAVIMSQLILSERHAVGVLVHGVSICDADNEGSGAQCDLSVCSRVSAGFDLGLERAGMECVAQVEIDPFCRAVLAKHWPDVPRFEDVRAVGAGDLPECDLICGGFPCQDVSHAGLRAGISGSRSGFYGELVRCLRVVRPAGALLENVAALLTRGMGRVLGDLAEIGYDTEWDCVPAAAVGALHIRDRVFIAAVRSDADGLRPQGEWAAAQGPWSWKQFEGLVQAETRLSVPAGSSGGMADGVPGRVHRLRTLGNAIVPQVAEVIGRAILSTGVCDDTVSVCA